MTLLVFLPKEIGEMAEWFMAPVLKTGIVSKNYRGFESLSLLLFFFQINRFYEKYLNFIKMARLKKPNHFKLSITNLFFNY